MKILPCISAVVFACFLWLSPVGSFCEDLSDDAGGGFFAVDRVIDGDTLRLPDGRKVHLLGVDAPELHHIDKMAREASRYHIAVGAVRQRGEKAFKFLNDKIGKGKVRLAFDWVKRDDEGSFLAYVYLEDGTLLNAVMLSEGFAYFDGRYPFQHQEDFKALENEARSKSVGVWAGASGK
ncbi:MAG: thermonuclease family protein [Candidatus Omnitrophica bacterium]|nr:thermonuclease family protein [Candidatus Omnitrophota bacterium]